MQQFLFSQKNVLITNGIIESLNVLKSVEYILYSFFDTVQAKQGTIEFYIAFIIDKIIPVKNAEKAKKRLYRKNNVNDNGTHLFS